ncbi:TadE/TadG family type IV pilus assembly protein, partial [Zhengella mangrovi]|uniref:TadE/TadG family type IV pilus assembly protein n=1 Tax=Zhengella mangrovi TaxID=1982044 RepID=UPI001FDEAD12
MRKKPVQFHRSIASDEKGNFSVMFGLMFVGLASAAGMGLDYSRVVSDRSSVQNAMDAALLAAMTLKHTPDEQIK